ncbi:MAG: O-antigen ligase family protein [Anaerolineales bacterium]
MINNISLILVLGFLGFFGVVLAFIRPYYGVIFVAASLPVTDLLPSIPYLTSIVIAIGAVTLVGFFLQRKREGGAFFKLQWVHILGLLFIVWMFVSNPQAAWFGDDRNWLFTFIQLWILAWLAGDLLDSPRKQHTFMWIFCVVALISAATAILQGQIGNTVSTSLRAGGLADQPNASARYFVIAMVFFSYLSTAVHNGLSRLLAMAGVLITFLGVFFTVSRTGILLLFIAIAMLVLLNVRRSSVFQFLFIFIGSAIVMWFLSGNIVSIINSIVPSIQAGTDTIGIRYGLWQAGWRMFLAYPIQGVGIGRFQDRLNIFGADLLPVQYLFLSAHNMYVSVLAETGLIGFVLFIPMLVLALINYLRAINTSEIQSASLARIWLIVFVVILIGNITMIGQYDKLVWLLIGVSAQFHNQPLMGIRKMPLANQREVFGKI